MVIPGMRFSEVLSHAPISQYMTIIDTWKDVHAVVAFEVYISIVHWDCKRCSCAFSATWWWWSFPFLRSLPKHVYLQYTFVLRVYFLIQFPLTCNHTITVFLTKCLRQSFPNIPLMCSEEITLLHFAKKNVASIIHISCRIFWGTWHMIWYHIISVRNNWYFWHSRYNMPDFAYFDDINIGSYQPRLWYFEPCEITITGYVLYLGYVLRNIGLHWWFSGNPTI